MRATRIVLAAVSALALLPGVASAGADVGTGVDDAARARLVGTHTLSLQWIDWGDLDKAGSVEISERGGILVVNGSETLGRQRLDIHGHIVSASADGFVFEGAITMQVDSVAGGAPCTRSGTMHFRTTGTRKYWRLQEMQSPCGSTTDYVDIYFLGI